MIINEHIRLPSTKKDIDDIIKVIKKVYRSKYGF